MLRTMRIAVAVVVAACLVLAPTATSVVPAAGISDAAKLRKSSTSPGMKQHEQAFQNIASANDDTRSSGTPGYAKSVEYVVGQLVAAGYHPQVQTFDFPFFQETAPAAFNRVSPSAADVHRAGRVRDDDLLGQRQRDGAAAGGERQPVPAGRRRRARRTRLRGGRLRRLRAGPRRADPARDVPVPRQGAERADRGRLGGRHLQRGPAGPHRRDHPARSARRTSTSRSSGRRSRSGRSCTRRSAPGR